RHHKDYGAQCLTAAMAVAIEPEHNRADRPHNKTDAKHGKSRQQRHDGVAARGKKLRDRWDEIPVNTEIVPFEDIADDAGGDRLALLRPGPCREIAWRFGHALPSSTAVCGRRPAKIQQGEGDHAGRGRRLALRSLVVV